MNTTACFAVQKPLWWNFYLKDTPVSNSKVALASSDDITEWERLIFQQRGEYLLRVQS